MLKHFATALVVLTTSAAAFAQNPNQKQATLQQDMRFKDIERPRSQFSQFLMNGVSVGLEYADLNADTKLTVKNASGQQLFSTTNNTSQGAPGAGVSVNYGVLRRNDFGLMFGLGIIKKLEDKKNSRSNTLSNSAAMMQYRPDINAAFSFANGIYGAAGANISVLDIDANDSDIGINKVGFGLQAQIGFIPVRNFGMDIGYYISRHTVKNIGYVVNNTTVASVDTDNSYADIKQLRARFSYLF